MTSSIEDRPGPRDTDASRSEMGLRELKKARTTAAIQRNAMRLFLEHGYDATTVETIAAASEVAASTVYRYFPTKEDLVTSDEFDAVFLENLRAQPAEFTVAQALRASIRAAATELSPELRAMGWQRTKLMLSEPALRGAALGSLLNLQDAFSEVVAARTGRMPDDTEVVWFTGAVIGVAAFNLMQRWVDDPELDILGVFEQVLTRLEQGFSL